MKTFERTCSARRPGILLEGGITVLAALLGMTGLERAVAAQEAEPAAIVKGGILPGGPAKGGGQGNAAGNQGFITTSALGIASGAANAGLIINPTFDASITSDPNAATIIATIQSAIAVYQAAFCDPITVNITFSEMTTGLGASSTFFNTVSYSSYLAALAAHATTANDSIALSTLPPGPNNPVNGNTMMNVATAHLRALGLPGGSVSTDSSISLNTSICNLDRVTIDPSKYDLKAVVMHEIDEAISIGSALDGVNNGDPAPTGAVDPADLFRYDETGARSLSTALSAQAFFSIDGGTFKLAQFNQTAGGDFGDWASTGIPHVQDAFGTPGSTPNLGVELTRLDVIGYCLVALPRVTTVGDVSFDDTCVGSSSVQTLYVCNTGTTDLQVGPIASSDSQFAVDTPSSSYPVTISPDFCFPFHVRFTPNGTGSKTTTLSIPSNDPVTPTITVQGSGKGVVPTLATAMVNNGSFGDVCVGQLRDLDLILNNRGGCDLNISGISSSSADFLAPTVTYPLLVHPGDSTHVSIRFRPGSLGTASGAISVFSNDSLAPVRNVAVSGNAPSGSIRLSGITDFGNVCAEKAAKSTISLCNAGACNLTVTSLALNACPDFTLLSGASLPAVIAPGSCLDIIVGFTPTTGCGPKSCVLTIGSDDPLNPSINLTFTAKTPCANIDVANDMAFPPEVIQSIGACTTLQPFPISNKGVCNLIVTSVSLGGANPGDYALIALPSFPITVQPGHVVGDGAFKVAFAPTAMARTRPATISVTYENDPVTHATTTITRNLGGEGVRTGARILVKSAGVPLATVEKIQIVRVTGNKNKPIVNSVDVYQNSALQTVPAAPPVPGFQYHREYGTVSNPNMLLPGAYQVTVTASINGKRLNQTVAFDVSTCDYNPNVVVNF